MKVITKYQAVDGREFFAEKMCVDWENWLEDLDAANRLFDEGSSLWEAFCRAKVRCGYEWEACYAESEKGRRERTFLHAVTKVISFSHYGQRHIRTESPDCWRALGISESGNVKLLGDTGSWAGPETRNEPIHRVVEADGGRLLKRVAEGK